MRKIILLLPVILYSVCLSAQQLGFTPDQIKAITPLWKGERSADGRPKVPDILIESLQHATLEQIWGYLGRKGYRNQVEKDWIILKPGETLSLIHI